MSDSEVLRTAGESIEHTVEMHEGGGVVNYWFESLVFVVLVVGLAVYALATDPGLIFITLLPGIPLTLWALAGLAGLPRRFRSLVRVTPTELEWRDELRRRDVHIPLATISSVTTDSKLLDKFLGYTAVRVALSDEMSADGEPLDTVSLRVRESDELVAALSSRTPSS